MSGPDALASATGPAGAAGRDEAGAALDGPAADEEAGALGGAEPPLAENCTEHAAVPRTRAGARADIIKRRYRKSASTVRATGRAGTAASYPAAPP